MKEYCLHKSIKIDYTIRINANTEVEARKIAQDTWQQNKTLQDSTSETQWRVYDSWEVKDS